MPVYSGRIKTSTLCDVKTFFIVLISNLWRLYKTGTSSITLGKMMSSPALHYQGKVFAFYYGRKMVFRLGRDFQPKLFNIQHYSLLAPFKTKPPMVDWFEIPFDNQHRWEELSRHALRLLMEH